MIELHPRTLAERKETHELRLMDRRHAIAAQLLRLEDLLADDEKAMDLPTVIREAAELLERAITHVDRIPIGSRKKREALVDGISRFLIERQDCRRWEIQIKKDLIKQGKEPTSAAFGQWLFTARCGLQKSVGKVIAYQREGYFILACEDQEDYATLYTGAKPNPEQRDRALKSVATQHGAFVLNYRAGAAFTCLLVSGIPKTLEEYPKLVKHERQHFINNDLLNTFEDVELGKESSVETSKYRRVKDELLARIREDRSTPERCAHFLDLGYDYLQKLFTPTELKGAKDLLHVIGEELAPLLEILCTSRERALIVNQLFDVPLAKIPRYLRVMTMYYQKKIDAMDPPWIHEFIYQKVNHCNQLVWHHEMQVEQLGEGFVYPTQRMNDSMPKIKRVKEEQDEPMYAVIEIGLDLAQDDRPNEELMRELKTRVQKRTKSMAELAEGFFPYGDSYRDPHVPLASAFSWQGVPPRLQKTFLPALEKVRKAVLEYAYGLPKETIVWLATAAKEKERQGFIQHLKVEAESISRYACSVGIFHLTNAVPKNGWDTSALSYADIPFTFDLTNKQEKDKKTAASFTLRIFFS